MVFGLFFRVKAQFRSERFNIWQKWMEIISWRCKKDGSFLNKALTYEATCWNTSNSIVIINARKCTIYWSWYSGILMIFHYLSETNIDVNGRRNITIKFTKNAWPYDKLLFNNKAWFCEQCKTTRIFWKINQTAKPKKFLWIGCRNSRVPANQKYRNWPRDIFVHANSQIMVVHSDLNMLSVLEVCSLCPEK